MGARRLLLILGVVVVLAATMAAVKLVRRGAPQHSTDDERAPGSVDTWPAVPRKPA